MKKRRAQFERRVQFERRAQLERRAGLKNGRRFFLYAARDCAVDSSSAKSANNVERFFKYKKIPNGTKAAQ
ncbi:MAG: hypothetical protein DBX55_00450 [Verrucomicrobia bacterium]|nr:MAG: hypothetical protein DBX55_00450 [Verrucomicrobiota bacterium]